MGKKAKEKNVVIGSLKEWLNNKKKTYLCPICKEHHDKLVKYHISYYPEKYINTCSKCNKAEYLIRNKKSIPKRIKNRALIVARFQIKEVPQYKHFYEHIIY